MTLARAIFTGFSVTCLAALCCFIIYNILTEYGTPIRTQILLVIAFLAIWAGITMMLRWM